MVKFYTVLITPYGEYNGEVLEGTPEQYRGLLEISKRFYDQEVYYQYLSDGTFIVIGRETIKSSIIMVKVIDEDEDEDSES